MFIQCPLHATHWFKCLRYSGEQDSKVVPLAATLSENEASQGSVQFCDLLQWPAWKRDLDLDLARLTSAAFLGSHYVLHSHS